jgi:hypothetical protein
MLFVAFLKMRAGSPQENTARRVQWQYPEGVNVIGEYWPMSADVAVVSIFETESNAPMMAVNAAWGDVFEIDMHPAVTAEEGLELFRQMAAG